MRSGCGSGSPQQAMSKTKRKKSTGNYRPDPLVLVHVEIIREHIEGSSAREPDCSAGGVQGLKSAITAVLQLVKDHACERKALVNKSSQGVELLLACLKEQPLDTDTVHCILSILKCLAEHKHKVRLVHCGAGEALLHMLVSSATHHILLLTLLLQLAPKMTKFSLKARLFGTLPVIAALLKQHLKDPHSLPVLVDVLRAMSANSTSAVQLCRLGCMITLSHILSLHGSRDNTILRHTLKALVPLLKTKLMCCRRSTGSCVQQLLSLHERLHLVDTNVRHVPVRRSILTALSTAVATDIGIQTFHKSNGLKIMYDTALELHEEENKTLRAMTNPVCTLLRKCLPKQSLPIPSLNHPLSFTLPSPVDQTALTHRSSVETCEKLTSESDIKQSESDDKQVSSPQSTSQPLLPNVLKPDLSHTASSCPNFPTVSPRSSSNEITTQSVDSLEDGSIGSQETLSQSDSIGKGREMIVMVPQVTEESNEDNERQGDVERQKRGTAWFIGMTPLESTTQQQHQECDDEKPEEPVDLSQFDIFFPELKQTTHSQQRSSLTHNHSSSAPALQCIATTPSPFVRSTSSYPTVKASAGKESDMSHVAFDTLDSPRMVLDSILSESGEEKKDREGHKEEVLFPHTSASQPELEIRKKLALERSITLEDTKRYIEPQSLINRVVYCLDEELQRRSSTDAMGGEHSNDSEGTGGVSKSDNEEERPITDDTSSEKEIPQLTFRAVLESSNLRKAIQVRPHEYDLVLSPDINSDHHHQWFLFMITGMEVCVPYRFNIINCEKSGSQFNNGMQPLLYSTKHRYWRRVGTDIVYYKNNFVFKQTRRETSASRAVSKSYYTLSFNVTFPQSLSGDVCYLAYHFPFTYSMLQTELAVLEKQVFSSPSSSSSSIASSATSCLFYHRQTLCRTLAGHQCHLLTITNLHTNSDDENAETNSRLGNKQYVVLTARVHPGESNSNWIMNGTIHYLLSSSLEADRLRDRFIFKIVPMLNPDGVINGSHRCSLTGQDLNRQWISPDPSLHPTIYHTKRLLQWLKAHNRTPFLCCDYHGHSRRKNVFLYGCKDHRSTGAEQGLPVVLDKIAPMFSLQNCSFKIEKSKEATARVVLWKELGITRSYTMESTYCGTDQGPYKGRQVTTEELEEMGKLFCVGLLRLAEDPPTITVDSGREETTSRASKVSLAAAVSRRNEGDTDDSSEEEEDVHSPTEGHTSDDKEEEGAEPEEMIEDNNFKTVIREAVSVLNDGNSA